MSHLLVDLNRRKEGKRLAALKLQREEEFERRKKKVEMEKAAAEAARVVEDARKAAHTEALAVARSLQHPPKFFSAHQFPPPVSGLFPTHHPYPHMAPPAFQPVGPRSTPQSRPLQAFFPNSVPFPRQNRPQQPHRVDMSMMQRGGHNSSNNSNSGFDSTIQGVKTDYSGLSMTANTSTRKSLPAPPSFVTAPSISTVPPPVPPIRFIAPITVQPSTTPDRVGVLPYSTSTPRPSPSNATVLLGSDSAAMTISGVAMGVTIQDGIDTQQNSQNTQNTGPRNQLNLSDTRKSWVVTRETETAISSNQRHSNSSSVSADSRGGLNSRASSGNDQMRNDNNNSSSNDRPMNGGNFNSNNANANDRHHSKERNGTNIVGGSRQFCSNFNTNNDNFNNNISSNNNNNNSHPNDNCRNSTHKSGHFSDNNYSSARNFSNSLNQNTSSVIYNTNRNQNVNQDVHSSRNNDWNSKKPTTNNFDVINNSQSGGDKASGSQSTMTNSSRSSYIGGKSNSGGGNSSSWNHPHRSQDQSNERDNEFSSSRNKNRDEGKESEWNKNDSRNRRNSFVSDDSDRIRDSHDRVDNKKRPNSSRDRNKDKDRDRDKKRSRSRSRSRSRDRSRRSSSQERRGGGGRSQR